MVRSAAVVMPVVCVVMIVISTYFMVNGEKSPELLLTESKGELILGSEYPEKVLNCIDSAKSRVWVCMYVMGYQKERSYSIENKLLVALVKRYQKGVDVRVILDAGLEWNSKSRKMDGPESTKNESAYQFLKENGVPVRYDSVEQQMHAKTVVIDSDKVVVGSANWTYSALKKNVEVSMLLQSKGHTEEMAKVFQQLWECCKERAVWSPQSSVD